MNYLLGVDFGGGACKATLINTDGAVIATAMTEYQTAHPQPGYAEQNPMDWYDACCRNIRTVLTESAIAPQAILAVALSAATHTAVLCDDAYKPLMPAIYWTDIRCTDAVHMLQERYADMIWKQALHAPDTIWSLPQLLWVRDNLPDIWKKTRKILFAKDFVRHCLTGDYVTDHIEAQGSMLYDSTTQKWSPELCDILGISTAMLPTLRNPADIVGTVTPTAARDTLLAAGTPVVCGTTDTAMEVYAAGAVAVGQMTVKLATAGRICVITDRPYPHPQLVNYSHVTDGLYYPGTATKSCAASYRWYRDTFGETYAMLDAGAESVPLGADGLLFHPYLNGELTPYGDPLLRGSFVGIRANHTKAHFSRAVLEGVALSLLDCKKELDKIGIPHGATATIIGGGAKSPLWRQITADCLNITLVQMAQNDSSFGSAMLSGLAVGVMHAPIVHKISETVPQSTNTQQYEEIFQRYKKVHDVLREVYHASSSLR